MLAEEVTEVLELYCCHNFCLLSKPLCIFGRRAFGSPHWGPRMRDLIPDSELHRDVCITVYLLERWGLDFVFVTVFRWTQTSHRSCFVNWFAFEFEITATAPPCSHTLLIPFPTTTDSCFNTWIDVLVGFSTSFKSIVSNRDDGKMILG